MAVLNLSGSDNIDWICPVNWQHPLNDGLIGWWLAVQNQGGWLSNTWLDLTDPVNGNHGTLTNMDPATDWTGDASPGSWGSLDFDGADDYVNVGDIQTTHPATMIACVNPATVASGADLRVICQSDGSSANGGAWRIGGSGEGDFEVWDGSSWADLAATGTLSAGVWYELGATYGPTGGSESTPGYVNGKQTATGATSDFDFSGVNMGIGDDFTTGGFGNNFSGKIAWVKVIDRQLSPAEMAEHYVEAQQGFPNLLNRVPRRTYFVAAAPPATSIPVFMHHYTKNIG